jgi:predicted nucleic acid-binding protein
LQHLDLLQKLYGRIVVPRAVVRELTAGREEGYEVPDLTNLAWIQVRDVQVPAVIQLVTDLGPGEAEVLALALEQQGTSFLILDDGFARQVAKARSLRVTGTAGLLVKAKQTDLIPAVAPLLEDLQRLNVAAQED